MVDSKKSWMPVKMKAFCRFRAFFGHLFRPTFPFQCNSAESCGKMAHIPTCAGACLLRRTTASPSDFLLWTVHY